jgi:phosphatidylserine decarboxylase
MTGPISGALLAVATATVLAWKWQLGRSRAALGVALSALPCTAALALAVHLPPAVGAAAAYALTLTSAAMLLVQRFYRDPARTPPDRDDVVVSPADGRVIYVRRSTGGALPHSAKLTRDYALEELTRTPLHIGDAVVVGIALSFLDVHVNRSPISGQIVLQRHYPGRFASLRRPEAAFENERATIVLERDGVQLAVVLIASRLVRRIVTFLREGEAVHIGERIGAIRFGSQVDVVLPRSGLLTVQVQPGDRVVAGETVLAATCSPQPALLRAGSQYAHG